MQRKHRQRVFISKARLTTMPSDFTIDRKIKTYQYQNFSIIMYVFIVIHSVIYTHALDISIEIVLVLAQLGLQWYFVLTICKRTERKEII